MESVPLKHDNDRETHEFVCTSCSKVRRSRLELPRGWFWLLQPDEDRREPLCGPCTRRGERATDRMISSWAKKRGFRP